MCVCTPLSAREHGRASGCAFACARATALTDRGQRSSEPAARASGTAQGRAASAPRLHILVLKGTNPKISGSVTNSGLLGVRLRCLGCTCTCMNARACMRGRERRRVGAELARVRAKAQTRRGGLFTNASYTCLYTCRYTCRYTCLCTSIRMSPVFFLRSLLRNGLGCGGPRQVARHV